MSSYWPAGGATSRSPLLSLSSSLSIMRGTGLAKDDQTDVDNLSRPVLQSLCFSSFRGITMEIKEETLIRSLIDTNPELRRHYEEHVELKRRLEELRQKPYLTEEEKVEEKRIQKQKLAGKDRIMEILARYRQAAA